MTTERAPASYWASTARANLAAAKAAREAAASEVSNEDEESGDE